MNFLVVLLLELGNLEFVGILDRFLRSLRAALLLLPCLEPPLAALQVLVRVLVQFGLECRLLIADDLFRLRSETGTERILARPPDIVWLIFFLDLVGQVLVL